MIWKLIPMTVNQLVTVDNGVIVNRALQLQYRHRADIKRFMQITDGN